VSDAVDDSLGIGLGDMIIGLRAELLRAQDDPAAADLPMVTGPIELELTVAVSRSHEGKTGIRFWVLEAGGGVERSGVTTQSFKIVLNAVDPVTGDAAKVSSIGTTRASSS
jgi:hypothetical protein